MRRKCIDNNPGVGNFTPVISTREQAEEIQFYMLRFYSQLHTRHEQFRKAQDNEGLKTTVVDRPDKRLMKEKERERRRRDKKYDYDSLSSSSSSDDDEKDYYDHHEAINFVPLFGAPSPDSNLPGSKPGLTPRYSYTYTLICYDVESLSLSFFSPPRYMMPCGV